MAPEAQDAVLVCLCILLRYYPLSYTYVHRGISALSADQRTIVVSNLCDGFDSYDLQNRNHVMTYRTKIAENVVLPVRFINSGSALLFGSACGAVSITNVGSSKFSQHLIHNGEPKPYLKSMYVFLTNKQTATLYKPL